MENNVKLPDNELSDIGTAMQMAIKNISKEENMDILEKAKIILEALDKYHSVDYAFEDFYLKGIMNGLKKVEEMEMEKKPYEPGDGYSIIK